MQKYNIPHTIGSTTNAVVRNAPQYTMPFDWEERGAPIVYNRTDKDFAVSVVTPRTEQTARARIHPTQPGSYSARLLRNRHHAPSTSKSVLKTRRQLTTPGAQEGPLHLNSPRSKKLAGTARAASGGAG
eukprot:CAMPEP_0179420452 /NCGR_PEP_ID=MMETSP0799-20121207/9177_1 /TAXON_ID=46947 /ORGANISM="Geminigera cryophila, Strain CCMP2564" /LENGTH=128 /DNA_ID=CAMNT_0021194067 /DNA_START=420 /DNA_END=802 /DNA_ORIENTATION=+